MLTVAEATEAVLATVRDFGTEMIHTREAVGRVLREPIFADRNYPPINRATMDGIAINRESWENGQLSWAIEATVPAGVPTTALTDKAHGCVQIMTGAEVPGNCDGIIPVEDVSIVDGTASASADAVFEPGQYIHAYGSDRKKGEQLLPDEMILTPPRIAIIASVGHAEVRVANRPRVAVVSTGDEIVPIDQQKVAPTEVRASNPTGLLSALNAMGISDVTTLHIADDLDATTKRIVDLVERNDVLILSGGVSKGKFDFVPDALEAARVHKIFHRVAQKPGKPLWFGQSDTCTVFGLPGNPVSTLTAFRRYVAPFLIKSSGLEPPTAPRVLLEGELQAHKELTLLLPVKLSHREDGTAVALPVEYHGSGDFAALSESAGFIEVPPKSGNERYDFWGW